MANTRSPATNQTLIHIIYGSSTCYTQFIAEKIDAKLREKYLCQTRLVAIQNTDLIEVSQYQKVIYGIPTWDFGELQEDWDIVWDNLSELDFSKQQFAVFGVGDQFGYPDWFVDAMGYLYHLLVAKGGTPFGHWPLDDSTLLKVRAGYQFKKSKALIDSNKMWCGLPIDEENQADLTDKRLDVWLKYVWGSFLK